MSSEQRVIQEHNYCVVEEAAVGLLVPSFT